MHFIINILLLMYYLYIDIIFFVDLECSFLFYLFKILLISFNILLWWCLFITFLYFINIKNLYTIILVYYK